MWLSRGDNHTDDVKQANQSQLAACRMAGDDVMRCVLLWYRSIRTPTVTDRA